MKMLRWPGFIAFVIITAVIAIFTLFFLDSIIKGALEKQASLFVGARVDIGDLAFKIFGLHLDIRNIQVTNSEQPMRNSVEVGAVSFDLAAGPLLKKKIVIEDMAVKALAFNTARKSSGVLPRRLQRKRDRARRPLDIGISVGGRLEECVLPDFAMLAGLKQGSAEDLLSSINLKSSQFFAEHRARIAKLRKSWEDRLQGLPSEQSLKADLKSLQDIIEQPPKDIARISPYIKKVNTLREKMNKSKNSLIAARKDFQAEVGILKKSLSKEELERLKNRDLRDVLARLDIKIPSAEDLLCVLVGKKIAKKVNYAIAWYRKLNNFMPAGTPVGMKEKPHTIPRMKGVDVRFPVTHGYPDFLIERADFSARPDSQIEPGEIVFSSLSGNFEGLTTQPALYGRPALFNLKGSLAGNIVREVMLSGTLDHRGRQGKDAFNLILKGLRLMQANPAISDKSPLLLSSAYLDVNSGFRTDGKNIEGRVLLTVMEPKITVGPEASNFTELFKNIGAFDVVVSVTGTLDKPLMTLSSSLIKTLQSGIESIVEKEMKSLQDKLKRSIASLLNKDQKKGWSDTDALEKWVLGSLAGRLDIAGMALKEGSGTVAPSDKGKATDLLKKKLLPFSF